MFEGTKRAAQRELARLEASTDAHRSELSPSALVWGRDTTVNDAIEGWRRNGWEDLSPNTTKRYESIWRTHIRDSIGRRKIVSLTPYELERFFRDLKQAGQAERSVKQVRAVLHRSCRLARKWSGGLLPNPVADTDLPDWQLHEQTDQVRAPSLEEVRALIRAAAVEELRMAVYLRVIVATGARRSEICAVRWADVDAASNMLSIDESIVLADGERLVRGPKNRSSIRRLAVDPGTTAALEELRASASRLANACGVVLTPSGFVFSTDPDGAKAPRPDTMSRTFARIRDRAGIADDVHLHSLRHFHSTVLDSVISEAQKQTRMGWATVQMARHYTDAVSEEDRRAASHLGELLSRSPSSPAEEPGSAAAPAPRGAPRPPAGGSGGSR
jgi:integrase